MSALNAQESSDEGSLEEVLQKISYYLNDDKYDSARTILNEIALQINDSTDELILAEYLFAKGRISLFSIGPVDQPTLYFLESLSLFTKHNDSLGIARCNLQLGVANYDLGNYVDAIEYLKNSIIFLKDEHPSVGICHYLMALCYSETGQFEEAGEMFDLAEIEIGRTSDVFWLQIQSFKGNMYLNRGDYQLALTHLNQLLEANKALIKAEEYSPIFSFLSSAYFLNGQFPEAIANGRKARSISLGKGSQMIYYRKAVETLHRAYAAIGNGDSAYFFLQELSSIKDSVSSSQILQRVAELKGQHEFEIMMNRQRAEQELKDAIADQRLERTRLTRNFVGGGLILAIFAALVFFRQRNSLSKEKTRSDNLLLNILPKEIAQELKDHGKAKARKFENTAILFTDFKEFTSKSEQLTPEKLVDEINTCFEAFDAITEKYAIEKIKTIGDAYMAVGGLPELKADSVKRTVLAALEMQHFIEQRHKTKDESHEPAFRMRVGINTGPVVAGIVGRKKFQYDIWGDTVNTASRIESMCEIGRVNISQSTYDIIGHDPDFSFESRGKLEVKGKGMMEMYFVTKS